MNTVDIQSLLDLGSTKRCPYLSRQPRPLVWDRPALRGVWESVPLA